MQPLSIVGQGATLLAERLVPELDGRVATIERLPDGPSQTPDASASFGIAPDGSWVGTGDDCSLGTLLD
jgi:molybdopterin synthase catalytic subunit